MTKEYVEMSEEEIDRRISGIVKKLENPEKIHAENYLINNPEIEQYLSKENYVDFFIDKLKWNGEGVEPKEIGYVKDIPPRGDDFVVEGYRISAMSIDEAISRINLIMDETEGPRVYFQVFTPDQPRPMVKLRDWWLNNYRIELGALEEAKRTGKIDGGYYDW